MPQAAEPISVEPDRLAPVSQPDVASVEYSPDAEAPQQTEEQQTDEQVVDVSAGESRGEAASVRQRTDEQLVDVPAGKPGGKATGGQQSAAEDVPAPTELDNEPLNVTLPTRRIPAKAAPAQRPLEQFDTSSKESKLRGQCVDYSQRIANGPRLHTVERER